MNATPDYPTDSLPRPLWFRALRWVYRRFRQAMKPRHPSIRQLKVNGVQQLIWLNEDIGWRVFLTRRFEADDVSFILSVLHPGDVFLDIGGNVGLFSLPAARQVGASGRVLAFEPIVRNALMIRSGAALNGFLDRIEVIPDPASDKTGVRVVLDIPDDDGAYAFMSESDDGGQSAALTTTTVDAVVAERAIQKVRAMKIDVEGAEMRVIKGASTLLADEARAPDYVLIELIPEYLARFDDEIGAVFDLMVEHGYQACELAGGRLVPCRSPDAAQSRNFVFQRP